MLTKNDIKRQQHLSTLTDNEREYFFADFNLMIYCWGEDLLTGGIKYWSCVLYYYNDKTKDQDKIKAFNVENPIGEDRVAAELNKVLRDNNVKLSIVRSIYNNSN